MKRAGFTMIELIFVIVILGILASVALPRFVGVTEQAQEGKLKAYVGTLNRTIGSTLWSKSLNDPTATTKGSIKSYDLNASIDTPDVLTSATGGTYTGFSACAEANSTMASGIGTIAITGTISGVTYNVECIDGDISNSPKFSLFRSDITEPLVR